MLLDFAFKTNNDKMATLLTSLLMPSIHYPSKLNKIYAAAYYNYSDILKNLYDENELNIDNEYLSGLTLLGVAIHSNSMDVVKWLIEKGAIRKGDYFNSHILKNAKSYINNIPKIFDLFSYKYNANKIPNIMRDLAFSLLSMNGHNNIKWIRELFYNKPELFKNIFLTNGKYARHAIVSSMLLLNAEVFDFLIEHGINLCLAFDNEAKKSLDNKRVKDESLWINARYKDYLVQCKGS